MYQYSIAELASDLDHFTRDIEAMEHHLWVFVDYDLDGDDGLILIFQRVTSK